MKSVFWAYVEALADARVADSVRLPEEEVRHVQTRRLREGDALLLFDGRGRLAEATIESLRKKEAAVLIRELREEPRESSDFVLASAIPKGDRLSTMLQMLSQLGVERWQPLVLADSSMRKLDPEAPRLKRILIESAKVARRAWLLEVSAPVDLERVLAETTGRIFFGDREGEARGLEPDASLLVIGPEAGLTGEERDRLLVAGAEPRSFAPYNLRIETAAIAGATAYHLVRPLRPGGGGDALARTSRKASGAISGVEKESGSKR